MTEELKNCPFCDRDAKIIRNSGGDIRIVCQQCECQTQLFSHKENAIKRWNTRAGDKNE